MSVCIDYWENVPSDAVLDCHMLHCIYCFTSLWSIEEFGTYLSFSLMPPPRTTHETDDSLPYAMNCLQ